MARRCSVCDHPERDKIDAALVERSASYRSIARQFGLSADAVGRHRRRHIAERVADVVRARQEELVEVVAVNEARERLVAEDLLGRLESVAREAEDLLAAARDDGDLRTAVGALKELRNSLVVLAQAVAASESATREGLVDLPGDAVALLRETVELITAAGQDPAELFSRPGLAICGKVASAHGGDLVHRWTLLTELYESPANARVCITVRGNPADLPAGNPLRKADDDVFEVIIGGDAEPESEAVLT
ncbi:MAG: hypothetical protein GXP27_07585 [Planctomycetes bacterium]|nr:hypothetical protein [Planctomycetota bacterium]